MRRTLVAAVLVLGAAPAHAGPPPAGGLEPLSQPCLGSTTLATGCPTAAGVLQGAMAIGVAPNGKTDYVGTSYGNGAIVALRRQPMGGSARC